MTRRLKRQRNFELTLDIKSEAFIRPPTDSQRNWLLNRAVAEFTDDLNALDAAAARFVPGANPVSMADRTQALLADEEIMEDWQIPLMRAMAEAVTHNHGDVLEIGFGRGIGSTFLQDAGVKSHTIIECNNSVVERYQQWLAGYTGRDIRLQHGLWQDELVHLARFDGVFFHTYPLNADEFVDQIAESVTFAEHFFPHAAEHLKPGGVFSYLSFEIDSMSRGHQRALLKHFSSISLSVLPLTLPDDVHDAWWADSMVLVSARR